MGPDRHRAARACQDLRDVEPDERDNETFTVIAGIRDDSVLAPMILPGAMNTEAFRVRVQDCLAPELQHGDTVIWDNPSIHGDAEARWAIEGRGARLRLLPPYSPDLNPIELAWSKAKTSLRAAAPRNWKDLVSAVGHSERSSEASYSTRRPIRRSVRSSRACRSASSRFPLGARRRDAARLSRRDRNSEVAWRGRRRAGPLAIPRKGEQ
jgi:transposase